MSRSNPIRLASPLVLTAFLAGCADYLNRYDTVTLAAGDAQKHNLMLQHSEPFNPASNETRIPTDGQRAADAVQKYRTSQQPGAQPDTNITINVTE